MPSDANPFGLSFHHLGLAVRGPRDATQFLGGLGYVLAEPVFDPEQNVNLIMCTQAGSMPDVEIIYPAAGKSPVDALVAGRPAGIVYHICYLTADLAVTLAALDAASVRAICKVPPTPATLFGGRRVSFYDIVGMGLVEIIEDPDGTVAQPDGGRGNVDE
ncbi:MAG TPA: VOC family protein [Stellaceae bacterium]|nr:VOC family protein [Stellaceae bacterium]